MNNSIRKASRYFVKQIFLPFVKVVFPLVKNILAPLATIVSAPEIDGYIQREMRGKGAITTTRCVETAGKGFALVISNEDME